MTPAPASDAASAPYASYGTAEAPYGNTDGYGYDTGVHTAQFSADPLFGALPGDGTAAYGTAQWGTDAQTQQGVPYDAYAAQHVAAYDTGVHDSGLWAVDEQQLSVIPPQTGVSDASGHWDSGVWVQPDPTGTPADQTQHWEWGTQAFDTGAYDATQWNTGADSGGTDGTAVRPPVQDEPADAAATAVFDPAAYGEHPPYETELAPTGELPVLGEDGLPRDGADAFEADDPAGSPGAGALPDEQPCPAPGSRMAARNAARSRRRTPPKGRSALMKIAVPSACVMGVTGIAAASVGDLSDDKDSSSSATATDVASVKPSAANTKLDTAIRSLAASATDFGDRVSRHQERIDLKAEQEAEKKKAAEEAARKERLRPKFALPVAQHGLSAYYGQSGVNWMSVHTGIDFPVSYGSTVMAATDGVVRTEWNSAYGNMMIVTAKDGTETWYCHLSSYRVPSGTAVKAGDPIAYSGNSGNSTGPHLHFEVRPGGGSAIDPLAWLRSHGLNPN
jgi:hypothetical protein